MTIFLCGFMGCGKTTVGELLAKKLGLPLIDTDAYIVEQAGKSIPDIFAQDGEPHFRKLEAEAIRTLCTRNAVISCGGGAMLKDINAEAAAKFGTVVYIDVPYDVCYDRISGDTNRPIVMANTKESLEEIYNDRVPLYLAHSQVKADGSRSPEDIAADIKAKVNG